MPATLPTNGVSSTADTVSATAVGTSFTEATPMLTMAVDTLPSASVIE